MADVDGREAEIEAVARALQGRYLGRDDWRTFADEARTAIAALHALRSSGSAAQECDCDEPLGGHRDDCPQWGSGSAGQNQEDGLREALVRIERLMDKWHAPLRHPVGDMSDPAYAGAAAWAAVGSEAHKIATDALARSPQDEGPGEKGI